MVSCNQLQRQLLQLLIVFSCRHAVKAHAASLSNADIFLHRKARYRNIVCCLRREDRPTVRDYIEGSNEHERLKKEQQAWFKKLASFGTDSNPPPLSSRRVLNNL